MPKFKKGDRVWVKKKIALHQTLRGQWPYIEGVVISSGRAWGILDVAVRFPGWTHGHLAGRQRGCDGWNFNEDDLRLAKPLTPFEKRVRAYIKRELHV